MGCEPCNELTKIEAQIEELHERHRQARVKRNYIHSPLIHQFPLEIVTSIFILASPPREGCPYCSIVPSGEASPLVLIKICHTWRALALSIPRLWSSISIDAENPNFPLLNHQIAHSGVAPLSVYLSASGFESEQELANAKQAMSLVIKQLHRVASLYLNPTNDFAMACGSIPYLDYPKTAPLLEELHFHCVDDGPSSSFQLKLAIEPPRPRQVRLRSISFDQICIDWSSVSSLALEFCDIRMLPPALKNLKRLDLMHTSWGFSMVSQSIQDVTHEAEWWDAADFMLGMTLPSLRMLDIDIADVRTLNPITCDFLHRSLCPLQVLTIHYGGHADNGDGEQVIRALIDVLEITKVLRHLTLRLSDKFLSSGFEPLARRFLSQDRGFLPCLQTLSLETRFIPPIDLLLDAMALNAPPSEVPSGPNNERPLGTLTLGLDIPLDEVRPICQEVLVRILQMRAAGKKISITCTQWHFSRPRDLVEHWKSYYGFGED